MSILTRVPGSVFRLAEQIAQGLAIHAGERGNLAAVPPYRRARALLLPPNHYTAL